MNDTIQYYDSHAKNYFDSTASVDFNDAYNRFLKYVPEHGRIIDIGCGGGRDVVAFVQRGFDVIGLDASETLAELAQKKNGIQVITADMAEWIADEPYDGIWCCASLLHLNDEGAHSFFENLRHNLRSGGAIYISVKSGIETGYDEKGRYMRNFTEAELRSLMEQAGIRIVCEWNTGDQLQRDEFYWINMIGIMS